MSIFEKEVILQRQEKSAEAFGNTGPLVVVGAGEPIGKPGGLDQTYPFLPHPEYYWLSGARRSGGVMAYEPGKGWTHFVRQADAIERLWEGDPEVPEGEDVAKLQDWLKARSGKSVAVLGSIANTPLASLPLNESLIESVRDKLDRVRRPKDEAELARMACAVDATVAAFRKAREVIKPGVTERHIQIEMEAEMLRHGADNTSFGTIVGAGTHAAVLHFAPGDRVVGANDLVLVDSGAEVFEYCSDVTRTYPAKGRFTAEQQAIYDLVLASQQAAIEKCLVGTEWHDVHRASASVIGQGLIDLGILRGSLDGLLENNAVALFFPHGVGHMVGLRIRDVGGRDLSRPAGRLCCGAKVRVDLPIEEHFVMTVEPGIYFVPAILDDPERRVKYKNSVSWDSLKRWRLVGGVRVEDDILITAKGPKVLTAAIPK